MLVVNIEVGINMEKDFCVKCGSENMKTEEKEVVFELKNPGLVEVKQDGKVCQECGEAYFDEKQSDELGEKFNKEREKLVLGK
jgi:YgiT-type zinc finger domain-containing protein